MGFMNLIVWKEAVSLAAAVNEAARSMRGPIWAKDQLLRAVESTPANIAEGYGRGVTRDCIRFFSIARASANESENSLFSLYGLYGLCVSVLRSGSHPTQLPSTF